MVTQVTLGNFYTNSSGKLVMGGAGGSGLDTQTLIKTLVTAKSTALTQDQAEIKANDAQSAALTSFQTLLGTFQTASNALSNPAGVNNYANNAFALVTANVNSNGSNFLTASASAGAALQNYSIDNITQLASAASQSTGVLTAASADASITAVASSAATQSTETLSVASADTAITVDPGSAAPGLFTSGTIDVNGQTITLASGDTLNNIKDKFNAVKTDSHVQASVVQVSAGNYQLQFSATTNGTPGNFDLTSMDTNGILSNVGLSAAVSGVNATANEFAAGTVTIKGQAITLATGDSLNNIAAKFNAVSANTGVSASVLQVSSGSYQMLFRATSTGSSGSFDLKSVLIDPNNTVFGNVNLSTRQLGTDANFKINGIEITRSSNSISDVISGVTFNLQNTTSNDVNSESNITVSVTPDTTTVQNAIVGFVNAYNAIKTFEAQQTQLNSDGTYATTAVLANNQTFRTIMSDINAQIGSQVNGITGSNPQSLDDIGITLTTQAATSTAPQVNNILTIDDGALSSALSTNFQGVKNLFGFNLTSNSSDLAVFTHTNNLSVSNFTLNLNPGANTFTATYNDGTGSKTVNLTATAFTGGIPGYTLTGQAGTALDGLELIYGSNNSATINVAATMGIADQQSSTLSSALTSNTGTLAVALTALQSSDTRLNSDITQQNTLISQYQDQLTAQFSALEQAISKTNSLLSALAANDQARYVQALTG